MTSPNLAAKYLLVALSVAGCAAPNGTEPASLDDGVYRVVKNRQARLNNASFVELAVVPLEGEAPETLYVAPEPLLRLRPESIRGFQLDENGECTSVALENTESLRKFSRDHVGSRLAVVVGGRIITHHKIRVPLETDEVSITFCTEGGGNHLMQHLRTIVPTQKR